MSKLEPTKLIPRNAPALRKSREKNPLPHLVVGNSVSTRLESGIGNCFPGLECDLRNLERRFFPFLELDMPDTDITVFHVDIAGAEAARQDGKITQAALDGYRMLNNGGAWIVDTMTGTFGPLGRLTLKIADLTIPSVGPRRLPPDAWTAVRLLTEDTDVRLVLHDKFAKRGAKKVTLTAKRARYLGDDGALAAMFLPGELTQSLCSPWTHDFRDCACFYWASNHPDIALPPLPSSPTGDPKWDRPVPWERRDRIVDTLPAPATFEDPDELPYFEINSRWQSLNFVIERREQIGPYAQREFTGKPLADDAELEAHLRYAAGVELAAVQIYLAAAYSLKSAEVLTGGLRDNVRAAHAQILSIAIGEMRHLRAVNNVLASLLGRPRYKPALGVATRLPGAKPGETMPVTARPLTRDTLDNFITIESPSESVDGVYARILATLVQARNDENIQAIRTVMAEGEDHYRAFRSIAEWLQPYSEKAYLRALNMKPPPASNKEHQVLQARYRELLELLYHGYDAGMPEGAADLNAARNTMIRSDGIVSAAEAVTDKGFLVIFDLPKDPRFTPIPPP